MIRRWYFMVLNCLWILATDDLSPFELEWEVLRLKARIEDLEAQIYSLLK